MKAIFLGFFVVACGSTFTGTQNSTDSEDAGDHFTDVEEASLEASSVVEASLEASSDVWIDHEIQDGGSPDVVETSTPPDILVGRGCQADMDCSELVGGYCRYAICSMHCSEQPCGAQAECVETVASGFVCLRVCETDSECEGFSTCQEGLCMDERDQLDMT